MTGTTPTTAYVVFSTAPDRETARRLGRSAVEQRRAACVQLVGPIESTYRWEGAIHEDSEVLILFKTVASQVDGLMRWIGEQHPYQVPELLAVPVAAVGEPYLAWMRESCRNSDEA